MVGAVSGVARVDEQSGNAGVSQVSAAGLGTGASPRLEHCLHTRLDTEPLRQRADRALGVAGVGRVSAHRARPPLAEEIEKRSGGDAERIAEEWMTVPVDHRDPREIDGPGHAQNL